MSAVDRFVESAGLRIHVRDRAGDGAPIVFVHGGMAHARWWDFVTPRFEGAHRVVTVDLRGHGDSAPSPDEAYGLADYATDVAAVLDALGLARPILVGHSLGAFVSLRLALDRPRGLGALVCVDARATFGEGGSRYMRLLRMFPGSVDDTLEDAVARFAPLPRETTARREVIEHVARESFRLRPEGGWVAKFDRATLSAHQPFDFRAALSTIVCPALFVRGDQSPLLSARAAAELASICRDGAWVEIANAYHHVPLDQPEALAAAIDDFLASRRIGG
jgi:pimeloyl-ACP methyl ester carboxylesterase